MVSHGSLAQAAELEAENRSCLPAMWHSPRPACSPLQAEETIPRTGTHAQQSENIVSQVSWYRGAEANMNEEQIRVADQVRLKSGGPTMTVHKVHNDGCTVTCRWFDGAKLKEAQLKTSMVVQEQQ